MKRTIDAIVAAALCLVVLAVLVMVGMVVYERIRYPYIGPGTDAWSEMMANAEPREFCTSSAGELCCVKCPNLFCSQKYMTALLKSECANPTPTPLPHDIPDWYICWGDCCVTQGDFEAMCRERE